MKGIIPRILPLPLRLHMVAVLGFAGLHAPGLSAQGCEDVSGAWAVEVNLPGTGPSQITLTLEQTECAVTGSIVGQRTTTIEEGIVEGSTATFAVMATNQANGESLTIVWEATVDGDAISGTLNSPMMGSIEFAGERVDG